MQIHELDHPLAGVALTRLRDVSTDRATFRRELHQLSGFVIYEALRALETSSVQVETPLALTAGHALSAPPVIVPILRAGLGMLDAALALTPNSLVGFVGARRNEETYVPETYLDSLPDDLTGSPALILDPMLATGGSLVDTVNRVAERKPSAITVATVLAAPEGIEALRAQGKVDRLATAAIDERLTDIKYITPGLGDAGDRQYGNF